MLVPETGVYLSTVPLLELEKGLYIGPGIACLDIELDDVDSGDVEANVERVFLERLKHVDVSRLYSLILSMVEVPREVVEASYRILSARDPMFQIDVVNSFDVTSISVVCKGSDGVYIRSYPLESPHFDIELGFLGKAKRCEPADFIQLLNLVNLYISISSRRAISSMAMVLDLLGLIGSIMETLKLDLDAVERLIGALHDVMLQSRLNLVDVREVQDFLLGRTSRYSELVEEHAEIPNKNLQRCITNIGILAKPRSREELVKFYRDACGYRRALKNLETALKALIKLLDNVYNGLYTISTMRGLRIQIEMMNKQIEAMNKQIKIMNKQIILAYIMIIVSIIALIISILRI